MIPGSFDPATAGAVVGDAQARAIEALARDHATTGAWSPPAPVGGGTYWDQVVDNMRLVVYREQFTRRAARLERKGAA